MRRIYVSFELQYGWSISISSPTIDNAKNLTTIIKWTIIHSRTDCEHSTKKELHKIRNLYRGLNRFTQENLCFHHFLSVFPHNFKIKFYIGLYFLNISAIFYYVIFCLFECSLKSSVSRLFSILISKTKKIPWTILY